MNETPHLTDAHRESIEAKSAMMQHFFMELQTEIETKSKHEDLSITYAQLEMKQTLYEAECSAICNTPPPPPPKKEEVKKEPEAATTEPTATEPVATEGEAQAAADDTEMASEEPPVLDEQPKAE
jgi:hypothetical protein